MITKKDYCDYETCVALKELGFPQHITEEAYIIDNYGEDEYDIGERLPIPLIPDYMDVVAAPTLYEAQKWLREEKEVYVTVIPEYNDYRPVKGVKYRLEVAHWKDDEFGYETIEWLDEECLHAIITFDSYEEALTEGVREAVKILKEDETL